MGIATVQICYYDGVSSGEVCQTAQTVATSTVPSAFNLAIENLAPEVWFKFEDTDFNTTITDSGSISADLSSQNTVKASVGAAMRSTVGQSLSMPGWTSGNWSTEAAYYIEGAGNAAANAFGGKGTFTIIMAVNVPAGTLVQLMPFIRIATNATQQTNEIFSVMLNATETGYFHCEFGGGNLFDSTSALDDGNTHLAIWRLGYGSSLRELELDGAVAASGAWSHTLQARTETLKIGGTTNASSTGIPFRSDCMAIWDRALSDAEIANLWTLYNAEKL